MKFGYFRRNFGQALLLSHNPIGEPGILAIAGALESCQQLRRLDRTPHALSGSAVSLAAQLTHRSCGCLQTVSRVA